LEQPSAKVPSTCFRVRLMVLNDMSWWGVEEYRRPWAWNAGIGDGKRFRSINLTFYDISEKGVRCDSKIVCSVLKLSFATLKLSLSIFKLSITIPKTLYLTDLQKHHTSSGCSLKPKWLSKSSIV
jgi:hypothetical protein